MTPILYVYNISTVAVNFWLVFSTVIKKVKEMYMIPEEHGWWNAYLAHNFII